jgi:hypothetical protein
MSFFNQRGIFLQLLAPSPVNPGETMVSMQFARKEVGYDAENQVETYALVDTTNLTAVSNDGGRTFSLRNTKDIDRDGDVDADDRAKLLALAVAYSRIINP